MPGPLHPDLQALLDRRVAAGIPPFSELTPAEARRYFELGQAALPKGRGATVASVEDFSLDGPAGPIALRRYRPAGAVHGRILYMHGGGWVIGTLDAFDPVCRELAAASGAEVVSVDYRLAPEHPFPGPLDDCWAVLTSLSQDGAPLAVAGDSAGGNLAAALALKARDEGAPAIRLQLLLYPVLDADFTRPSYRDCGSGDYLLSTADMAWFWNHHCPPDQRGHPYVAPVRAADVSGVAPAIIVVAGCDPLHDEGVAYAERLQAAGIEVALRDHPDMAHGFCTLIDLLAQANAEIQAVGAMAREHLA